MSVWALILAAGAGTRFGSPKQFASIAGARLVDRVVLTASATCDAVVLVLPSAHKWNGPRVHAVTSGGATRSASVRAGLSEVPAEADIIVVHDAAHPLAAPALFRAVIDAVRAGAAGAVPGLPITEALKRISNGEIAETVPRTNLMLAQTPQAFRADVLRRAHADAPAAAEDSALAERIGAVVAMVPGDPLNLHITTLRELEMGARLCRG